jgi:hypothetical protein
MKLLITHLLPDLFAMFRDSQNHVVKRFEFVFFPSSERPCFSPTYAFKIVTAGSADFYWSENLLLPEIFCFLKMTGTSDPKDKTVVSEAEQHLH